MGMVAADIHYSPSEREYMTAAAPSDHLGVGCRVVPLPTRAALDAEKKAADAMASDAKKTDDAEQTATESKAPDAKEAKVDDPKAADSKESKSPPKADEKGKMKPSEKRGSRFGGMFAGNQVQPGQPGGPPVTGK